MRFTFSALAIILVLFSSGTALAGLFDAEDFESIPLGDVGAAADWTAMPNSNVVSGGLSYQGGPIRVDGGSQALQVGPDLPGSTVNNYADWIFDQTISDSTVWFSFLLQTSENASTALPDVEDTDRNFFQIFFSADGNNVQSHSMVLDNNRGGPPGGDHNYRARAGSSSGAFTDSGPAPVRNQPGQTAFLVGRIDKVGDEYETVSLYANPVTASPPATPTAMSTRAEVDYTTLAQATVRISGLESDDFYLIDEFRVGQTWADVTGIPEPASASILCLTVGLLMMRRRRPNR